MMTHNYSTDSSERRYIPFFIAAVAIIIEIFVLHLLEAYQIRLRWWASPPIDTMAFYGSLYWVFDQYIWKWKLIRWLRISRIPDLSGTWHGHAQPTVTKGVSEGLGSKADITVRIKQTWTNMLIVAQTSLSKSHSVSGNLITADEPSISYEYTNEPSAEAPRTMHTHRGVARLTINDTGTVLEGEYYSGRDRQNIGTIRLTRT
jgi:hypothetical protein